MPNGCIHKKLTEVETLVRQLSGQEAVIRDAFLAFVSIVKSDSVLAEVNALLAIGDIEGALAIVDTHIVRLSTILPKVFVDVGNEEASRLTQSLALAGVAVSFDPTDARAVNIIRANKLEFVRRTTESQRDSIRQALVRAFEIGEGPRATAAAFKDSIGLTPKQEQAVINYRSLLEANSAASLDRKLRDRRSDRSVLRALDEGDALKTTQIDSMVDRYRERFVKFRAEVIARTEGTRATSQARDEALRQVLDQENIPTTAVERKWNRTADARTRDHHDTMQNQKVGLDQPFIDGLGNPLQFPGDPSAPLETTAQCRCVVTIRINQQ